MKIKNLTDDVLNGAGHEMQPGETVTVDDEEWGRQLLERNPEKFAEVIRGEIKPYVPEPDANPGENTAHRHIYTKTGRTCTVKGCTYQKGHRTVRPKE